VTCTECGLKSIKLNGCTALKHLSISKNQLKEIDITNNLLLVNFYCDYNQLTTLDVSKNTALEYFGFSNNEIKFIDVSNNTALSYLSFAKGKLETLILGNNPNLKQVSGNYNPMTSIDVSGCPNIGSPTSHNMLVIGQGYEIELTDDNKFDLSALPEGFDISKAYNWKNCTLEGTVITVENPKKPVCYSYDGGTELWGYFELTPKVKLLGDVNLDEAIDAIDASIILAEYARIATGATPNFTADQIKAADVNKDGAINSSDASIVLAYYSHISTGGKLTIEEYIADMKK
jgi:hypothetical protein